MERNEILKTFLESGYQLNTDALAHFESNQDDVKKFLDLAKGRLKEPTVTSETIANVLSHVSHDMKVIKTFYSKPKDTSVEDLTNILSKRYEKIAGMMSGKPDLANLISINRISQQNKKFSVIGMVKEIERDDRGLVIEDPTGSTSVYVPQNLEGDLKYVVEDDVIGLVFDNEDSTENKVVKIVFPDIPLSTRIRASTDDITCIFVSDIHVDDPKFMDRSLEKFGEYLKKIKKETIVFVLGDVSDDKEKVKKFTDIIPKNFSVVFLEGDLIKDSDNWLPDPVVVDVGGVRIFMSHGSRFQRYFDTFKTSPENMMLQMLKKRHLSPTTENNKGLDDEKLVIDEVPDIFVLGHYHDPRMVNYKGVTLMSLGSFISQPVFWAVNLKTRENIKIDLT